MIELINHIKFFCEKLEVIQSYFGFEKEVKLKSGKVSYNPVLCRKKCSKINF